MNKLILTKVDNLLWDGQLYVDNILVRSYDSLTAFEIHQRVSEIVGVNKYQTVRIDLEGEE